MKTKRFVRRWMIVAAVAALAAVAVGCGGTSSAGGSSGTPSAASPTASAAPVATPTETPTTAGGGGDAATGGVKVTIANTAFSPSKIEVKAGTTVTWTNNDTMPHTVTSTQSDDVNSATSGLFDSGTLQPGQSFSYTFKKAGKYPYECTIHATLQSMHGKVEVK